MAPSAPSPLVETEVFDYLCVDEFLKTIFDARALGTAFDLGLIDALRETPPSTPEELGKRFRGDGRGLRLLLGLLKANGVVEERDGKITLTPRFLKALCFRDLMQVKIEFSNHVVADFAYLFNDLIVNPERFFRRARVFDLFGYNRCFEYSPENYELTRRWVEITTTLTRYEAGACMAIHDFSGYGRVLDIGGNSGEFVLQLCRRYPGMSAAVLDLPLVCEVGKEHVRGEPESERIAFIRGNALTDDLPAGFDLILFKSMLHDWPEREARLLMERAAQALEPGGRLLVFERGPFEAGSGTPPYSMIPFLLFFRSFRSHRFYEDRLRELEFQDIEVRRVELEMPFHLVTGTKQ